mmetsp:Transcript_3594/g.6579  ORF Transcript_3594/g.6579 Transcript_3594/m.6579 type:complete len:302 (+) Transcript_3594:428-1333(+)
MTVAKKCSVNPGAAIPAINGIKPHRLHCGLHNFLQGLDLIHFHLIRTAQHMLFVFRWRSTHIPRCNVFQRLVRGTGTRGKASDRSNHHPIGFQTTSTSREGIANRRPLLALEGRSIQEQCRVLNLCGHAIGAVRLESTESLPADVFTKLFRRGVRRPLITVLPPVPNRMEIIHDGLFGIAAFYGNVKIRVQNGFVFEGNANPVLRLMATHDVSSHFLISDPREAPFRREIECMVRVASIVGTNGYPTIRNVHHWSPGLFTSHSTHDMFTCSHWTVGLVWTRDARPHLRTKLKSSGVSLALP